MTAPAMTFPDWLRLREPADAAARSHDLVRRVRRTLPVGRTVVHDLGAGAGAMGRWLAPLLPGPQHWVLHDRDPVLLALAAAQPALEASNGARVTLETREHDVTRLVPGDLAGATLVAASALLDILTEEDLDGFVSLCTGLGVPVLVSLTVTGRVTLTPSHPMDDVIAEAFNAHQRRPTEGGRLLGPDAVRATAEAFGSRDREVLVRRTPWVLGPDDGSLMTAWLHGWVGAAVEHRPESAADATTYLGDRLAQAAAGTLHVRVEHEDLLALPGTGPDFR